MTRHTSEAELLAAVIEVLTRHLEPAVLAELPPVDRHTRLSGDLPLDSLTLLKIVVDLEDRFEISLDEEAESSLETVGDLVDFLAADFLTR